tara:strand:- start:46 stop:609 length:564 start_codon:yes stop_codon:yes gene_type:complete
MSKLEANQVDPATGTTLTLGTSGDTITIPSGVTIANSGTATGFGGTNTPSFLVTISGTQSISNATNTKIQFNSEIYDTDNTFDSSTNYRFTPGVAGKYALGAGTLITSVEADEKLQIIVNKNGSQLDYEPAQRSYSTNSGGETVTVQANLVVEANTTDYFEIFIYHTEGGTRDIGQYTYFHGYKLIT